MTFVNEKPGTKPSDGWRTVDYERDAVLYSQNVATEGTVTPGRGAGHFFKLKWKQEEITFKADLIKSKGSAPDKCDYKWVVIKLEIPSSIKPMRKELFQLIADALQECGFIYDSTHPSKVEVDFSYLESSVSKRN